MKERRDQEHQKTPAETRGRKAAAKNGQNAQQYERDLAESIIETVQTIVLLLDTQGRIVRFNPYMEEISGYTLAEVQGADWFTIFLPERDREQIRRLFLNAVGDIRTRGNVNPIVTKDGREREIEWYDTALKDRHGNVIGLLSVGQDITERKREAEALLENEQRIAEALAFKKSILATSSIGILTYDAVGRCIFANKAAAEIAGTDFDGLLSQNFHQLQSWKKSGMYEAALRALDTGSEQQIEAHVVTTFGKDVWLNLRFSSFQSRGEKHLLVFTYDITGRKRAEEALRESKEQLALILDSAAEGIYGLDLAGNCTFCNPATLRLLGYREEKELLGKSIHDLAHHTKADGTPYPRSDCLVTRISATGDNVHSDQECLWRSDGGSFPAEFWAHPMCRDGQFVGTVVTFIDRTEHVALERQLLQAQKLEAVGQLAAGVAHDFNNILSSIIGHAHLALLKTAKDDPLRLNVESLLQASYQASRLVQSLLAVGRQQMTSFKPADLNAVVAGALKYLARTIGLGVELKTAGGGQPLPVLVDTGQIELVLQNLAANAVDAMPRGGTLSVAMEPFVMDEGFIVAHGFGRPGTWALLSVSDTGAGMDTQTQKRIFEPFFSTKEAGKNTGLGLAVVYGIVRQHAGYITVSSRPGTGTTFSIYLPLLDATG